MRGVKELKSMRGAISPSLFAAVAAVLFSVAVSFGQNGSIDQTFGTNGVGTIVVWSGVPLGSVIDSNGRILILLEHDDVLEIACFTAEGQPDETFGTNGLLTAAWSGGNPSAIALQNDNGVEKIIVAGHTSVVVKGKTTRAMRVDRFFTDGTLDGSFGSGGSAVHRAASAAAAVATDSAGNIYTTDIDQKKLVKLTPNGALAAFGSGGVVDTSNFVSGRTLRVLADGKILVAGTASVKGNKVAMSVARYNASGSVDTTFGTNGRTTLLINGNPRSQAYDIKIDQDGKIVLAGTTSNDDTPGNDIAVVRLTPGGQSDGSFSLDGMVSHDIGNSDDIFRSLDLQDDGKIVVGGFTRPRIGDTWGQNLFSVVRFHSDGSVDTLFGNNGSVITDPLPQYTRGKYARTVFARGNKLILAGFAYADTNPNFATVVRYEQ